MDDAMRRDAIPADAQVNGHAVFVDEDEARMFNAAKDALIALADKKGCDTLAAFWWLYAAPFEMKKATYSSYYGRKEVWTVTIEVPERFRQAAATVVVDGGLTP